MTKNGSFADWNPHFTPRSLSLKVAGYLPEDIEGTIFDPACGAGNLLLAAALRFARQGRAQAKLKYVGVDKAIRAVRDCGAILAAHLPQSAFRVRRRDFLADRIPWHEGGPITVLMNPPFQGYGEMSAPRRRFLSERFGLRGRFNLAHAFLVRSWRALRPDKLIAIIPSHGVRATGSSLHQFLDEAGGTWEFEDVEGDPFPGVSTHVGVLVWKAGRPRPRPTISRSPYKLGDLPGVEVSHGAASGSDAAFASLGRVALSCGRYVAAARGRDVGRETGEVIWVPPARQGNQAMRTKLLASIPKGIAKTLRARSCVISGRREVFQFHDRWPEWFLAGPKLLLPEIATGELRVELDSKGRRFPLHSVIAIRVPSIAAGEALYKFLRGKIVRHSLQSCPRLRGGAIRLSVETLRSVEVPIGLVRRWETSLAD